MSDAVTTLDTTARYAVDEFPGVAFYVLGWQTILLEPEVFLVCEVEDCEHDEVCWAWSEEVEEVESDTWVRAVMVGDDVTHLIEVTSLHQIADEDYCGGCGQIGCTAWGRN